jgi:hypothetical protein
MSPPISIGGAAESRYDFEASGGGGGAGTITWNDVTLAGGSLVQDPLSAINAATYGAISSITLNSLDPGNISGTPDCPIWRWDIGLPPNYVTNSQLLLQVKLTAAPNQNYQFYLGAYDGTVAANRGAYGTIRVDNGNTGANAMGSTPSVGNAAASIVASGGSMEVAMDLDADNSALRGVMVRTTSNTGPAYGRYENNVNPNAMAGGNLYGFIAIGATASRTGGAFTGIQLRWALVPAYV